MINKQKLWFLTLFSIILVLSVYYIAIPTDTLTKIENKEKVQEKESKQEINITEEDSLTVLRIEDEEETINTMKELQKTLLDGNSTSEIKNNAYEELLSLNLTKGKETNLEELIKKEYNIKSFIKIKEDQINVTIISKNNSYEYANDIIRTIQKEFNEKKYITVKYQ